MRSTTFKTATYWLSTGLLSLDFLVGGAFQIARSPQAVQGFAHLGYPAYFVTFLGVWKVLGALALLVPGFPRLKEWAYAGIFFDVSAAVISVVAVGDGVGPALLPFVFVLLTLTSWALRPASRTMQSSAAKRVAGTELAAPASAAA
ncbi:MAG TPA: DoxX family protein [Polyangiaceae bacterium]|nr:DoxX family protein [Polyangiaceae bacterium]